MKCTLSKLKLSFFGIVFFTRIFLFIRKVFPNNLLIISKEILENPFSDEILSNSFAI